MGISCSNTFKASASEILYKGERRYVLDELLLDDMIIYGNSPLSPIERNRKCFLNISQQKFEF